MNAIFSITNFLYWANVAVTSGSPVVVKTLAEAGFSNPFSGDMQLVMLWNTDTTNTIYLGWDSTVSSTKCFRAIAPQTGFDILVGRGAYVALQAVASAGTPNMNVSVLG